MAESVGIGESKSIQRDPNMAASVEAEEYTLVHTAHPRRHIKNGAAHIDDDEPLIDTTAKLALNSKKTKRLEKQQLRRRLKTTVHSDTKSFLELPSELLHEVLSYLRPSDIFHLLRLNSATRAFIQDHETSIARDIIGRRYWVLSKCFPLPIAHDAVDKATQIALLNPRRQDMLIIHKKPYQHIKPPDPLIVCSCTTCVLAWNNLCLLLDFAHFQTLLDSREPIPLIARGTFPQWNHTLIQKNAEIVTRAMKSPLCYAGILEVHLRTTVGTLLRQYRVRPQVFRPDGKSTNPKNTKPKTVHPKRLFHLSQADADAETDEFLERSGPPSYEFPFHRDNYYSLQAYVPNRKWSKEEERWKYYDGTQHEKDLAWALAWFRPREPDGICRAAIVSDVQVKPKTQTGEEPAEI